MTGRVAALRPDCPTCNGSGTIAVAGPDSFGMYDTDDCPRCNGPVPRQLGRLSPLPTHTHRIARSTYGVETRERQGGVMAEHEGRIKMILDGADKGDWIAFCTGCDWHIEPRPIDHTLGEAARDHERQATLASRPDRPRVSSQSDERATTHPRGYE